ncbi:hypothetical protein ACPZ19_08880 [Amycolatopsis lurida]
MFSKIMLCAVTGTIAAMTLLTPVAHAAPARISEERVAAAVGSATATLAAPAQQQGNYEVGVGNFTSLHFDEIVLAYTRHSQPIAQLQFRRNVPPFSVVIFDLGPCADVKQYAVSGIIGGVRVVTTGDLNADPGCEDIISFTD